MEQEQPKEYSNRELYMLMKGNSDLNLEQHKAIFESIKNFHETTAKTLEELVIQTKKTNGNVMDLLLWRMYVKGQTYVIPLVIGALVSGVVTFILKHFNIL